MVRTFQETVGIFILFLVALIHAVVLPTIEIILFQHSKDLQKVYLEKNYGSRDAFDTVKFILVNLGFYNVMCGLAVAYAVYAESTDLLRALMYVFIGNGLIGLYLSLENYFGALSRAIPAAVALGYLKFLPNSVPKRVDMPWSVVLIPVILHFVFFVLESVLFPTSKFVQKMFVGKAASSPMAVDASKKLLFRQGFYNLFLAFGTIYGLVVENNTVVRCFMMIVLGASLVLVISAPKLYRGALIQGGPALLVLYVLF